MEKTVKLSHLKESKITKKNKDPITITNRALNRVRYLLDKKKHTVSNVSEEAIGIRILIKQKGCSGLKYNIEYAYDIRPFELIIEAVCSDGQKIKVLIDPKSAMFMLNAEMDYVEEKFSSGFVFKNPNEKGKCGCGESFHV